MCTDDHSEAFRDDCVQDKEHMQAYICNINSLVHTMGLICASIALKNQAAYKMAEFTVSLQKHSD